MAIEHAHRICDWQENLMPDEMPPPWMWPIDSELDTWFEEVEAKRKDRYGGGGSSSEDDSMMSNELTKGRRG